jgi:hypothetical protein
MLGPIGCGNGLQGAQSVGQQPQVVALQGRQQGGFELS